MSSCFRIIVILSELASWLFSYHFLKGIFKHCSYLNIPVSAHTKNTDKYLVTPEHSLPNTLDDAIALQDSLLSQYVCMIWRADDDWHVTVMFLSIIQTSCDSLPKLAFRMEITWFGSHDRIILSPSQTMTCVTPTKQSFLNYFYQLYSYMFNNFYTNKLYIL